MSLLSRTGHVLATASFGVAGTLIVGVPTAAALLAATAAFLRGLGSLREEEQTPPEQPSLVGKNVQLLSPYNLIAITTKNLLIFAGLSAVLAVAAHKGLSCFGFGRKVLGDASWLVRNVLPVQFAAPTLFGLRK
ncbi:MAG TPA: hypothetical protein VMR37_08230 [Rhabdochlamydiaceae bacterium]|jgi:hypothetical protein|nr:hypothetical protein [Rhabdochlamydiaceae bacterium]